MTSRTYFVLAILYSIATFVLSSIPGGEITVSLWKRWDLIAHLVEYAILSWLIMSYLRGRGVISWMYRLSALGYCALIGGLNEIYQSTVPGRTAAWDDEIANVVGALLVLGLWVRNTTKQQE